MHGYLFFWIELPHFKKKSGLPICLSWSFQTPFGPSGYWTESPICDKLKHQKRCLVIPYFWRMQSWNSLPHHLCYIHLQIATFVGLTFCSSNPYFLKEKCYNMLIYSADRVLDTIAFFFVLDRKLKTMIDSAVLSRKT